MSKLDNKVAVVTGASKGIGAGIARALAAEGASVVVNYDSSREGADRVVADIKARGGKAVAVQGSVAKEGDVARLFDEAEKQFGHVDVLVNNAGVYGFAPIAEVNVAEFHRQFDTNVLGTLLASREAAKRFNGSGGSIINVSSVVSENPMPGSSVYSATKGAVDAITQTLAKELGARGIRVNTIAPGPVSTEGFQQTGIPVRTWRSSSSPARRWDASASRMTSRAWRCSWLRMMRRGSPVSASRHRVACADRVSGIHFARRRIQQMRCRCGYPGWRSCSSSARAAAGLRCLAPLMT